MNHLPLYRHPSMTVLVDDSESFLQSMSFQLGPRIPTIGFSDTSVAVDWMAKHGQNRCAPLSADYNAGQCSIACDIDDILNIARQPERCQTPTVLVVDYCMPQMNGVEFCERVAELPCKKILFTGAADEKIAVNAFNHGLIDRYFRKGDPDALGKLEAEIGRLQRSYFVDQTKAMRELLSLHSHRFVADPAVNALVEQLTVRHGFIEHYLYHDPAGVMFMDAAGKASLLILLTDADMRHHYEVASDSQAPPSLLAALEERRIVPFFHEGDGLYDQRFGSLWYKYAQPAQVLLGYQHYYWAVFPLPGALKPRAAFAAEAA